jgi:hypothetical protein
MTTLLSNEEKAGIINQHLKNLHYNKFNLEISVIEENAKNTPEADILADLNTQILDFNLRIEALEAELDKLV